MKCWGQVIYLDTPGIMAPRPKERLNKAMVKSAWNSARDADEAPPPTNPPTHLSATCRQRPSTNAPYGIEGAARPVTATAPTVHSLSAP